MVIEELCRNSRAWYFSFFLDLLTCELYVDLAYNKIHIYILLEKGARNALYAKSFSQTSIRHLKGTSCSTFKVSQVHTKFILVFLNKNDLYEA